MNERHKAEPQTLEYAASVGRRRRWLWFATITVWLAAFALLWASLRRRGVGNEYHNRIVCAGRLQVLGDALYIYAQREPNWAFPDRIGRIFEENLVSLTDCHCPEAPAGRPSYFYVPGCSPQSAPNCVVAYEDPKNHGGKGGNVLYAGGSVEYVRMPAYQKILDTNSSSAQVVAPTP